MAKDKSLMPPSFNMSIMVGYIRNLVMEDYHWEWSRGWGGGGDYTSDVRRKYCKISIRADAQARCTNY